MGVFAPGYSRPERKGESTEFQRQCASIMLRRLETALAHQLLCLYREIEGLAACIEGGSQLDTYPRHTTTYDA